MNREIFKAKIAEVISSTNKSGNEKLEAILAVVDAYSSADNGVKPIVSGALPKLAGYLFNGRFYKNLDELMGRTMSEDNKPIEVFFGNDR